MVLIPHIAASAPELQPLLKKLQVECAALVHIVCSFSGLGVVRLELFFGGGGLIAL